MLAWISSEYAAPMRDQSRRSTAVRRIAAARAAAVSGSSSTATIVSASACRSVGSTQTSAWCSPSRSCRPGTEPAMAGHPQPTASISATGKPSWSPDGSRTNGATNALARANRAGSSCCGMAPRKPTWPPRPRRSTCARSAGSSGPKPMMSSVAAGRRASTSGSASRRWRTPFFATSRPTKMSRSRSRVAPGSATNRVSKSTPIGTTAMCGGRSPSRAASSRMALLTTLMPLEPAATSRFSAASMAPRSPNRSPPCDVTT